MKLKRNYKGYQWVVIVEPGEIASIGFLAPFKTRERARAYINYWKKSKKVAP